MSNRRIITLDTSNPKDWDKIEELGKRRDAAIRDGAEAHALDIMLKDDPYEHGSCWSNFWINGWLGRKRKIEAMNEKIAVMELQRKEQEAKI